LGLHNYRGVTESINNLINVYTSAAPGQTECDNAIRAIQSSRHVLENSNQSISDLTYYECLDTVMEKSKALGDGMTGIANHAKRSEHDEFGEAVKGVAEAICGLVEAAAQASYLVGVADPSSVAGRRGLVDQAQFLRSAQAIKKACIVLCAPGSGQQQILTSATIIAKHTSSLCNTCRTASSKTTNPVAKKQFVQSAKDVANATATLVKEIKALDPNYTDGNRQRCSSSTKPLLAAVDNLCQFASTPEFASVPARISDQGRCGQEPILESGHFIIEGSCSMIHSAKSLAVNPKDPPTWQSLANSSKSVSDAIKKLVSSIRDKAPGQRECEDAIERLALNIRELDQASLAAINQNLPPSREKDIKAFTEQMENAAAQLADKLPEVQTTAKSEAERLGHAITALVSYFDPLVSNAIGCASNMVSSKQQVLLLDQTKTVAECAQQLFYATKESGGNPKAQHVHGDIDESADSMNTSINELVGTIAKLAPNMGVVSRMVNCITEAIYTVEDYRPGSRGADESDSSGFVMYQSRMMSSTKEIARTAQDLVIKSSNEPDQLGRLASHMSTCYQELAADAKNASAGMGNADFGQRIRGSVKELGTVTIELIKATGSCQMSPHDSFALRDVSENARAVGEKCSHVLSALSAASSGTHALENAANTVSGILGDLDTTIMFATAGTLNADTDEEVFADHRENILKTAKALVEDTKTLVAGAASSQEQLAVAAQNAVTTIVQLSEVVKSGAASLGSPNREAQVMLINAVKDVAAALADLMQSTKAASGKNIHDPAMHQLKESAKVSV
jgi:talin